MTYARRIRASWVLLASLAILFTVVSNLVWNAQRTAAISNADPDERQGVIRTIPSVLTTLFDTATPTPSVFQMVPGQVFVALNTPTYTPSPTRTPTPINLGNFVWDDIDQDGRQDAGEPGLSGVTVQLWNPIKNLLFASTVTNANGNYMLVAPIPDQYRIRVVLPSALDQFSPKDQAGGDDTDDSDINQTGANAGFTDVITLGNNVISMTSIDAGIVRFRTPTPTRTPTPINLGNFVWDDIDQDGRQDAGEPGLSGVTVQLWNGAKTQMFGSTTTNASGSYTLIAPLPGQYRIRVLLPSGIDQFSPKDQAGGDDTDDSDINPSGTNAGFTDIIDIAPNVISMTSIDAGIMRTLTFQPNTNLQIALPTATQAPILAPPVNACGNFRLTSPLDGLPNGVATFYWDPANLPATYQIIVMNESQAVLAVFSIANTTNLTVDVSQGAIGGGFQLIVRINAIINGQALCTDEHVILRAAPQFSAPPVLQIIPTATCPVGTRRC